MALRAYWTGNLKISLVTVPVRLYNAVSGTERVRLHQVHRKCLNRIRMPPTCPVHGQVDRSEIVKAYEFEKDRHVIIEQEEIERIRLRTEKTIELRQFVAVDEVEPVYFDSSYYMAPDGPVADEPFRVVREALRMTGVAGLGHVTFAGRERPVIIRGGGAGCVVTTLHTAAEVRKAEAYYEAISEGRVNEEHLALAVSLIKGKTASFDPAALHDRYEDALVKLVQSKVEGQEPVIVHEDDLPASFNFADALRQSLKGGGEELIRAVKPARAAKAGKRKPPAPSQEPAAAARRKKRA